MFRTAVRFRSTPFSFGVVMVSTGRKEDDWSRLG